MEKSEGFIAWAAKGLATDGFGAWLVKNFDTIGVCLAVGLGVNVIAAFHRKSDFRSLAYGLLATFLLIGSLIWMADDYGIRKVWWPILSLAIGGASLSIVGAYLRFVTRLEEKLPDAVADAVTERTASYIKEPAMELNDILSWAANAPDDFWSAERFWHLSERFPDWWQFKAWLYGACFLLLLMYPRSIATLPARIVRGVAAAGALIIFATLFNQGLGWLGDLVFVVGFFGMCLDSAIRGSHERRAVARALEETVGIQKMTPERAMRLAVTGRLHEAIAEVKTKGERACR